MRFALYRRAHPRALARLTAAADGADLRVLECVHAGGSPMRAVGGELLFEGDLY